MIDLARLNTVQLVPLTPFSADAQRVVPEKLTEHIREMRAAGMKVFLPAAGTSEFHSLSTEEVGQLVAATRAGAGKDAVVMGPVGFGLPHAIALGKANIEAGADCLIVMPPVHAYLSDPGIRDYLDVLRSELKMPLVVYKKGPFPSDELLLDMGSQGQINAVKYAVNDIDAITRFVPRMDKRVGVYCGTAERFAIAFAAAGVLGFTTGAGNLCPRLSLAMHKALAEQNYLEANRLLTIIRPIEDYRARSADSYNVSMLKYGISTLGKDFGPIRPPMRKLTSAEEAEIRQMLEPIMAEEKKLG